LPDCYFVVNTNPRPPGYAREIAQAVADAVGANPNSVIYRFDKISERAHVFVPLTDENSLKRALDVLRDREAIIDYAVVDRPSEAGLEGVDDYPSPASSAT
jgi:hypothetical protein